MPIGADARNLIQTNFNIGSTLFWLHQRRELRRFKPFFDAVESQPLTDLQRRSVILNERRNLVRLHCRGPSDSASHANLIEFTRGTGPIVWSGIPPSRWSIGITEAITAFSLADPLC
jgi:hypothetical protein